MIFILKNFYKIKFNATSRQTLRYILETNPDVLCYNYQFNVIKVLLIKLNKFIKYYKNPINLKKREQGIFIKMETFS